MHNATSKVFLFWMNLEMVLAIVAITIPSSKIYLILEAIKTSNIVGKAANTPLKKLFKVSLISLLTIIPVIMPPIKNINDRNTTIYPLNGSIDVIVIIDTNTTVKNVIYVLNILFSFVGYTGIYIF